MNCISKLKVIPGKYNPFIKERRHYYNALIFDTKEKMWEASAKLSTSEKDKNGYGAITIPTWREKYVDGKLRKVPKIGNVLFLQRLPWQ